MSASIKVTLLCLVLLLSGRLAAAEDPVSPALPAWQVLEFEEKAFWATARSRLELNAADDAGLWRFDVVSSVVGNSEELTLLFDGATGAVKSRERVSKGKELRAKFYTYGPGSILRERRVPGDNPDRPVATWNVSNRREMSYPPAADKLVVTSPYLLFVVASELQAQGPGATREVLVHTDLNFFRVRLTCGNGIPIDAAYSIDGQGSFTGRRDTIAVSLHVEPEGDLEDKADFSLLGLEDQVILFFDKDSGLPLQVRGIAPRIGATEINLNAVTMRQPLP